MTGLARRLDGRGSLGQEGPRSIYQAETDTGDISPLSYSPQNILDAKTSGTIARIASGSVRHYIPSSPPQSLISGGVLPQRRPFIDGD
jgi:hypothetical protein